MNIIKVEHFTEQVYVLITVIIDKVFQFIFHSFLIINLFNLTVLSCNNTKNKKKMSIALIFSFSQRDMLPQRIQK